MNSVAFVEVKLLVEKQSVGWNIGYFPKAKDLQIQKNLETCP